jgi:WD40 repeat protein
LKAFIIAENTLYIYSKLDHLQTIQLSVPANDVSFLPEGAFGVLAGGSASGITAFRTCDDGGPFPVATTPAPTLIRPLLGASQLIPSDATPNYHFVALDSPNIDIISVHTTPTGCTPTLSGDVASYNLGQGNFTASQLLVSEDGSRAYIISPSLNNIPVFSTTGLTSSSIALTGNVTPAQAALTPDGGHLYVAASDGTVHVVDTNLGADIQQITFPQNFCLTSSGQNEPFTCKPDLLAVKP